MFTGDGANSKKGGKPFNSSKVSKRRASVKNSLNIPRKFGFRGFQNLPKVAVSRYDISSFLNNRNKTGLSGKSLGEKGGECSLHERYLSQKCTVRLVNEDLELLRKGFLKSIACNSDCDSDSAMANLKCKICEKAYCSEKKLQKHLENKHMIIYKANSKPPKRVSFSDHVIIHEVKEYHKCRKCSKIFENYKMLKTHMKQQHKKRKCYICNYCNKNFADRTFFKVHIKLHCDICSVLLPNKQKFTEHRRNVCRVLKMHKCKTCNELFFKFMDLKDHMYEHISTYFICDICKDQFQTKCGIAHHISFLHSKERPTSLYGMRNLGTERVYLCNFCDTSSVDRDILEKHTQVLPDLTNRAMTGYEDYYFCDQCLQKFETEMHMLKHKWTHFLKASQDESILNRNSILLSLLTKKNLDIRKTYKVGEKIPEYMKPVVRLEKIKVDSKVLQETVEFVDIKNFDNNNSEINKEVVNPKNKKTITSKHQCQTCGKYYSSSYSLNRHIESQHSDFVNLRCKVCEETFVWPSLLRSHKCIRLKHPEMPFDDARPEIHFDNLQQNGITENGFDDLNISEHVDYMNIVDFEIPAPIVELTEYEGLRHVSQNKYAQGLGPKLMMQEVPIEF